MFLFDEKFYFSIASEKQPDADNKNKIAFGRSDWLHEFKLSANWLKTTERYVPEIYYPKKGFHFDTERALQRRKIQLENPFKTITGIEGDFGNIFCSPKNVITSDIVDQAQFDQECHNQQQICNDLPDPQVRK